MESKWTLEVTENHIINGNNYNLTWWAVALALRDKGIECPVVFKESIYLNKDFGLYGEYKASKEFLSWQNRLIYQESLEPIKLEFDDESKTVVIL